MFTIVYLKMFAVLSRFLSLLLWIMFIVILYLVHISFSCEFCDWLVIMIKVKNVLILMSETRK